uniref:Multifunctional fusion protein n=1 Tax=Helminthora furcellata TaxID=1884666 RepID=A0A1G4NRH1_9FLOR|nr:Translation elongation factor Ts [Helminthora furcellata]SCW21139.1 Translation elongation factor Ts [Helminthora furcellata]SCW23999.1 Translation elongation factor Ts [Helminthora furcellata]
MGIEISAQYVKELRGITGAGMMDCKKALQEASGDIDKAIESLRQKGLASASKKSGRRTAEGLIESYIHAGSKIGVMVEINCETDFVARRPEFQELTKNIAMQIAASPQVEYVDKESIPNDIIEREKTIESGKDDICNKPENVQIQIVKGRVEKRLNELSLMDQAFIRNTDITIRDLVNEKIALIGENIQIRRFVRFLLGEGLEKVNPNFSEEVASMIKS